MFRRARWAATAAALALAAACDESTSPTGPVADPSGNVIVFADGGALAQHEGAIRDAIESAIARAGAELPIRAVTITVGADPSRTIPNWGMGGFARGGTSVDLHVDPSYPGIGALVPQRLPPLTTHELHHIVRQRAVGYGSTLLGALVSEGLADQFALELYGGPPPPWVVALEGAELERWLEEAEEELDSTSYDHAAWFTGGSATIPNWAGYAIGHELVIRYQDAHPGDSAADLVDEPAESFRPD